MSNQKKFGVWMDSQHATIVSGGTEENDKNELLAHIKGGDSSSNSSEKNANNHEQMVQAKFFKEISSHLVNATHVHITGTGQAQEQFIHYLHNTPQFKNVKTEESTSNKMSDEALLSFFSKRN